MSAAAFNAAIESALNHVDTAEQSEGYREGWQDACLFMRDAVVDAPVMDEVVVTVGPLIPMGDALAHEGLLIAQAPAPNFCDTIGAHKTSKCKRCLRIGTKSLGGDGFLRCGVCKAIA